MWKGTKLYSIFRGKCPKCHEGKFFESHLFDLKRFGEVRENCSSCGLKYSKEPGFYQGAYYVAYAIGTIHFVASWAIIYNFFPEMDVDTQFGIIAGSLLLLSPLYFFGSKIIWGNLFIHYNKE